MKIRKVLFIAIFVLVAVIITDGALIMANKYSGPAASASLTETLAYENATTTAATTGKTTNTAGWTTVAEAPTSLTMQETAISPSSEVPPTTSASATTPRSTTAAPTKAPTKAPAPTSAPTTQATTTTPATTPTTIIDTTASASKKG